MRDRHQGGETWAGGGASGASSAEACAEFGAVDSGVREAVGGVREAADGEVCGAASGARRKLKLALVGLAFAFAASAFACSSTSGGASVDTPTARLYRRQCAACHGPEGAGGQVGSLSVADLRAPHAAAYTDAQIYQKIHDGEKGMPPFKYSLSEQQIHDLVRFIRNDIQKREKK